VRHNYHHLRKKKNHVEEKLAIASEQRLVLIKEVKSLSADLDNAFALHDSLLAINLKLEDKIKQFQHFILLQYQQPTSPLPSSSSEFSLVVNEAEKEDQKTGEVEGELTSLIDQPEGISHSFNGSQLLLSSNFFDDLNLDDLTQRSYPPSLITLFEETFQLLNSSAAIRLDGSHSSSSAADHRNSTRIIQEQQQSEENESTSKEAEDDLPPKNSLFGKMLNLDPSALLDSLRSTSNTSPNLGNTNQVSSSEVSRRLRSASLTLSTASQGLISSLRNYNESSTVTGEKDSYSLSSTSARDLNFEHLPHPHSPSIPPPVVLTCHRCHGTVEGPKYSTCTCAIPSVHGETENSFSSSSSSSIPVSNSLQQHFWKGVYDTKNIFHAAVNIFHPKKSGQHLPSDQHQDLHQDQAAGHRPAAGEHTVSAPTDMNLSPSAPLPPLATPPPLHTSSIIVSSKRGGGGGDSDDEEIDSESEGQVTSTATTTVTMIFPLVHDLTHEPTKEVAANAEEVEEIEKGGEEALVEEKEETEDVVIE
jgi:hypothetical protein